MISKASRALAVTLFAIIGALAGACVGSDPDTTPLDTPDSGTTTQADSGGTTPDTGSGGGDDAGGLDASAQSFCEKNAGAAFCADFDKSTKPEDGWDQVTTKGGGTLELLTSPVRGARTLIPALSGSPADDSASAVLTKSSIALGTKTHLVLELSMRTSEPAVGTDVYRQLRYFYVGVNGGLFGLFRRGSGYYMVSVRKNSGGTTGYESPPFTVTPKVGQFSSIKLDIELSTGSGKTRIDIDGVQADFYSGPTLGDAQPPPYQAEVVIGAHESKGPTPALDVAFDDVLLTLP